MDKLVESMSHHRTTTFPFKRIPMDLMTLNYHRAYRVPVACWNRRGKYHLIFKGDAAHHTIKMLDTKFIRISPPRSKRIASRAVEMGATQVNCRLCRLQVRLAVQRILYYAIAVPFRPLEPFDGLEPEDFLVAADKCHENGEEMWEFLLRVYAAWSF